MKTRAALWLMLLGPLFFASYSFANWITAQRQNVPSIVFGWEHSIPFPAWMIVPYWSTDLLYAASLFMCRTRHELDTHAKRLLAVQLFSVTVFLAFPLRFSFQRPAVTRLFGAMFESLMAFDKPFNQAPSLHLSERLSDSPGRVQTRMTGSRSGWIVFSGVVAVLLVASVIALVLNWRLRESPSHPVITNLNARIKAWWVMVIILAGALMAGRRPVILLFVFISFAALREFITLTPTRKADHMALAISFLIVLPGQYILVWTQWYGVFTIFIPVYVFLILPVFQVVHADTRDFSARTSTMQWGLMIAVYCISHVPALMMLSIPGHDPALLIVFSILVVQASDVFQYVCGKPFGRHRIAPTVSPSKTVEGLVGGVACATGLGAGLWWITPFNVWQAAAMSLLIAAMGFVGGLVMSAIKRDRGVKDWGRLVEGHGGILDRLDSVCFAAPVFFHLTRYFFAT